MRVAEHLSTVDGLPARDYTTGAMNPLVSIGIPCFNAERWIGAAIESALAQTWMPLEVIVVDDGSSDGSLEIARGFGDRIQLLAGAHGGGNRARNQALAHARGEWVQFLDADDYLEPEKIAQQLAEAEFGAHADVIHSPYWCENLIDGGGSRTLSRVGAHEDLFSQWLSWEIAQTGAALWRKAALERIGGWKEGQPCCQEHELYLRAMKAELRFVFAPTPGAVYRIWSNATVCRKDQPRTIEVRTGLTEDLHAWMLARNLWTETHAAVAGQSFFEMARSLATSDLAHATAYHDERRARGLLRVGGPAAPRGYQLVYRALGFRAAERLAATRRRLLGT